MFVMDRVYLDYAATTPVDNRVIEVMNLYNNVSFGNPSSLHSFGTDAKDVLTKSREVIAKYIGARPEEVYFTSGGTESNNFAIKGIAFAKKNQGNNIIVSSIEHDCILNSCKWLESQGFEITYLPVDNKGTVEPESLLQAINPKTILVSVMSANNEIGTLEPIDAVGKICKEKGILFHCDACQSFGKLPIDVEKSNIDLLTINSHKIYGPKGVGALYIRKGTTITPLLHGGGQENGLRSTTENIPGIAGFAKAAEICYSEIDSEFARLTALRNKLSDFLINNYDGAYINGDEVNRLPGHLSFCLGGLEGETIRFLFLLDEMGFAVSAGSACSSNQSNGSSHVLKAIGLDQFQSRGGIRVTFGRFTTEKDLERFMDSLKIAIKKLNNIFSN